MTHRSRRSRGHAGRNAPAGPNFRVAFGPAEALGRAWVTPEPSTVGRGAGPAPVPHARGTFHLWPDGAAFVGGGYYAAAHERFPASLCLALDAPFQGRFGSGPWRPWRGVLVAPNVRQEADMRDTEVVVLIIDPESDAYGRISCLIGPRRPVHPIPEAAAERLAAAIRGRVRAGTLDAVGLWAACLDAVGGGAPARPRLDPRVERALDVLKGSLPDVPLLGDVADTVGLSESRLTRLFNAALGLSVRRYVQWLRLRHVVFCMAGGDTITTAAHEAGFADLAHLSRTFRSMFGLPISSFFGAGAHVDWRIHVPPGPAPGPHAAQDCERWAALARTLPPGAEPAPSVGRRRRARGGQAPCGLGA